MKRVGASAGMALALLAGAPPPPASSRPFTVEDLLQREAIGAAALDPTGRRLVFEAQAPYASAPRFDYEKAMPAALSRLRVVGIGAPEAPHPLIAADPAGVVMGPFSPSGDHLAVFRLRDRVWTLGVVTLATGQVVWLPITPQDAGRGRALQWIDARTLLVIDRPDGRPPLTVRQGGILPGELPPRWAAAASGAGSHTVFGSGRYAGLRTRGAPNRLVRLDVVGGEQRELARGEFIDLELSPDRQRVALFASGPDVQPRPDGPVRGPAGSETEATRLSLLDLRTGAQAMPCPTCDVSPNLLAWSPSGRRLVVFVRGPTGLWTDGRLQLVDATSGAAREVGAGVRPKLDLNPVTAWTDWLGDDPLIYGQLVGSRPGRGDWFRLHGSQAINLTRALPPPSRTVRLGLQDGFAVLAGGTLWRVGGRGPAKPFQAGVAAALLADGRFDVGGRQDRAPRDVLWLEGPGGALAALAHSGRLAWLPPGSEASTWTDAVPGVAGVQRSADEHDVETLSVVTPGGGFVAARINPQWSGLDPLTPIPVRHRGPGGEPLVSWLYLPPPDLQPAPLLVRPYLGADYPRPPGPAGERARVFGNLRVLTGRGYAVLVPSLPAPPGGLSEPAAGLAARLLEVVQAAVDTPAAADRLDPARLGVMGHSFGGYSVMATLTQTRCFRAGVAMDGISDLIAYWASLPSGMQLTPESGYASNWRTGVVEQTQPELRGPPWSDPQRYLRNSPLFAADRIETPLLMIHGGQDGLSVAQSEAMYSALFRQGKDAQLAIYWGAGHAPTAPGDIRDVYDRTFRFLDDHLGTPLSRGVGPAASPERASANAAPTPRPPPPTGCPRVSPPR